MPLKKIVLCRVWRHKRWTLRSVNQNLRCLFLMPGNSHENLCKVMHSLINKATAHIGIALGFVGLNAVLLPRMQYACATGTLDQRFPKLESKCWAELVPKTDLALLASDAPPKNYFKIPAQCVLCQILSHRQKDGQADRRTDRQTEDEETCSSSLLRKELPETDRELLFLSRN